MSSDNIELPMPEEVFIASIAITDELNVITGVLYEPEHQVANTLNRQFVAVESDEIKSKNSMAFQRLETFDYENPLITEDG